jgi:hypothetical protein
MRNFQPDSNGVVLNLLCGMGLAEHPDGSSVRAIPALQSLVQGGLVALREPTQKCAL